MIVVYLQGGLGNQMFQYAFGKALSLQLNMPLYFDTIHFDQGPVGNETPRNFQLNQWKTECSFASENERRMIKYYQNLPLHKRVLKKLIPSSDYIELNDASVIDLDQLQKAKAIFLRGYFQNESYFDVISQSLRQHFVPVFQKEIPFNLEEENVSVHIRRGDYVTNKEAAQHHGTCNAAYYEYAFKLIKAQIPGARFVFFSDDIEWCKEAFDHLENKLFIEPKSDDIECDDLYRMSRCNHHIIANSSYSWWGAWLNNSENKMVISPKKWIQLQITERNEVVPKSWIQI